MSVEDWLSIEARYQTGLVRGYVPPTDDEIETHIEKYGTFASVAPELLARPTPMVDVDLLSAMLGVLAELGIPWTWPHQRRGSCVGTNTGFTVTANACMDHAVGMSPIPSLPSIGAMYAGSKVDIGGNANTRNTENGDGSNGVWVAKWLTSFGVVTRKDVGLQESDYVGDEALGVKWASQKSGVPAEIETIARQSPVDKGVLVTDSEQVRIGLTNGYGVAECSGIIPSMSVDSNGVSKSESSGGHCMPVLGYRVKDDTFLMPQSWSDKPTFAYVKRSVIDRILKQKDTYIYAGIGGVFKPKDRGFWLVDHSGRPQEVFKVAA